MTDLPVQSITDKAAHTVRIVDGCHLAPISTIQDHFDITPRQAKLVLEYLQIPCIAIGATFWYNLYTLDKTFYYVSRAGGVGFSGPGNIDRRRGRHIYMPKIQDSDLEIINSLDFTLEWLAMTYYRHDGRPHKIKQILRIAKESLKQDKRA